MLPIATLLSARRRGPHFVVPRRLHLVTIPDHFCFPEGVLDPRPLGFTNTIPALVLVRWPLAGKLNLYSSPRPRMSVSGLYPVGLSLVNMYYCAPLSFPQLADAYSEWSPVVA